MVGYYGFVLFLRQNGFTPLLWAAYHHNTEMVRALLDKGANTDAVDFVMNLI